MWNDCKHGHLMPVIFELCSIMVTPFDNWLVWTLFAKIPPFATISCGAHSVSHIASTQHLNQFFPLSMSHKHNTTHISMAYTLSFYQIFTIFRDNHQHEHSATLVPDIDQYSCWIILSHYLNLIQIYYNQVGGEHLKWILPSTSMNITW